MISGCAVCRKLSAESLTPPCARPSLFVMVLPWSKDSGRFLSGSID